MELSTLLLLQLILLTLYLLGTAFYNIFLHPLRSIPGPPLAKLSKAWSRYGNLKGRKSHRIHDAHCVYGKLASAIAELGPLQGISWFCLIGDVVRVAPNEISFADPAAVRDIYMNDAFVKEDTFYVS